MKRTLLTLAALALLFGLGGCSIKVTKPMLRIMVSGTNKVNTNPAYADSVENKRNVAYVENGTAAQVVDIYYAPAAVRKDAVLIDIHGGFYVAGKRENNRKFASVFLKEGYDVVLLEYRVNDGATDVSDELHDCAAALDFLTTHAEELGLNPGRMFLTGDSAGGHLALYMAEGAEDPALPIRPQVFQPRGVMLNCPAYDFASFSKSGRFARSALAWFLGPRYEDDAWMKSMSPRTFIGSYGGPLLVSTCTRDFIRSQSVLLKADCEALGRPLIFVDVPSSDKKVGHVHNVTDPDLPDSQGVNARMVRFMDECLSLENETQE